MSPLGALPGLAVGPLAAVAAFLALTGMHAPRRPSAALDGSAASRWAGLWVRAALEEVVWRALVLGGLLATIGPIAGLAVSSSGFALWHRPALGRRCAVHLVTGAAFGAAFLVGGLVAAIVAHCLYNTLVDLAVHGERARLRGP